MPRRDEEIVNALPIHDRCLLASKLCPNYEHEAKDVCELLRCMRREGIRPLDVDTADSLQGLLNPKEAERLRERAPIRKRPRHSPVEIAKIWDLPLSFILELEK
jgi:hypothetical protein